MPDMIYHWCPAEDWDGATDRYRAPSLETEGFIHCSRRDQVERTATTLERWNRGMVILAIDPTGLPVVEEDLYAAGESFPHIYSAIPVEAVREVRAFEPELDGSFRLPPDL
ncbi:MAG: DUF952 domain-containing protein [Acidimicrobiia bacterium]